jgi:hypothetical protein
MASSSSMDRPAGEAATGKVLDRQADQETTGPSRTPVEDTVDRKSRSGQACPTQ